MSLIETLFILGNLVILPFWLLMIIVPRWDWTRRIMASFLPVVLVAMLYLAGLVVSLMSPSVEADMSSITLDLRGLAALFSMPQGAAVAWLHMLALDLFAGRWAYLDSRERRISFWQTSVALFLILMAGPLGVLIYLALRGSSGQRDG